MVTQQGGVIVPQKDIMEAVFVATAVFSAASLSNGYAKDMRACNIAAATEKVNDVNAVVNAYGKLFEEKEARDFSKHAWNPKNGGNNRSVSQRTERGPLYFGNRKMKA